MSDSQGRPRLQVVVVTYSPGTSIDDFLTSVSAAWSEPVAVTVVDNGSRDGTVERLSTRRDLEVVVASSNVGYGSAANLGVAQGSEPWILVANPDVVLGAGALDELVAVAGGWCLRAPYPHPGRAPLPVLSRAPVPGTRYRPRRVGVDLGGQSVDGR